MSDAFSATDPFVGIREVGSRPDNAGARIVFRRDARHDAFAVYLDEEKLGTLTSLALATGRACIDWDKLEAYDTRHG